MLYYELMCNGRLYRLQLNREAITTFFIRYGY